MQLSSSLFTSLRNKGRALTILQSAVVAALALAAACLTADSAQATPITIDWVTVGDPGNAADWNGKGAVGEAFRIMKFEWTNSQYVQFLNAVDPEGTDTYGLYEWTQSPSVRLGITNTGTTDGSRYAVKNNMGDKPVNYVSWFDAARVANWLHNGQGLGSTETGAYTLNGATSGSAPAVNPGAQYYIPTENQWYKAAYYKGGSTNAGYWTYATQADVAPTAVLASSTGSGSAGQTGNYANFNRAADWNG